MNRSRLLGLAAVLLAGLIGGFVSLRRSPPSGRQASERPHVILITIDTLRADRVGAYGGPRGITPTLDAMARRGVMFLDATAHASLTLPSHATIFTGQWPTVHAVRDNAGFVLPESATTLAELLRASGYRTAAFVGSFVLTAATGMAQGFDTYADRFKTGRTQVSHTELQKPAAEVVREALAWLGDAQSLGAPLFVWVHLYDPHAPYAAPAAFAERFPGQPYNAEVAATDWAVGDLMSGLPKSIGDRSVVVVTADHGESLDEHGEPEHGIFVYDSTLRVPLIVSGIGVPAGRVVREQVRHVDLAPTLCELTGVPAPSNLVGTSLVHAIHGEPRAEVPASYSESWFGRLHFGWSELGAIRTGDWKFVQAPRAELYDLRRDPHEQRNLIDERPEIARRLAERMAALAGVDRPASAPADSATLDRLRSLGYLAGPGGAGPRRAALGADPKDRIAEYVAFVTRFYEALDDLEQGRGERALERFRELARHHPQSYEAHQYVGRTLAALGRYGAALDEYRVVLQLKPDFAAAYFDAAHAEAERKNFREARRLIERGLAIEPASFYGHYVKGRIDLADGRLDAARSALDQALKLNPGMALAHYELGRVDERQGARPAAAEHYRQALASDEDFVEARRALDRLESTGKMMR